MAYLLFQEQTDKLTCTMAVVFRTNGSLQSALDPLQKVRSSSSLGMHQQYERNRTLEPGHQSPGMSRLAKPGNF